MTHRASAASPIAFVSAAGIVRVPQNFISWNEFTRIDSWSRIRISPGWQRQFSKPSELGVVFLIVTKSNIKFVLAYRIEKD
jgi:hypothetical protein